MKAFLTVASFAILISGAQAPARAEVKPDRVFTAEARKTEKYVKDGMIVGGDKAIDDVAVKDIRRASNSGFERIVIDLDATRGGQEPAIQRPPFYQVAVTPDEKRVVFTIWGKPRLEFDAKKVIAAFKKSAVVQNVALLPRVDEDSWTFAFELKGDHPVEVFELSNPVRITMDIKSKAAAK